MSLKHTPLYDAHKALGAKTGEFAGYDMPLYYTDGVIKEHEWTRASAGLFDVSHMGQVVVEGPGAAAFFEKLTPSSFSAKKPGRAQYTVLTNEQGGIIDDLIVTRVSEEKFFVVINAGRKDVDIAWMRKNLPAGLKFDYWEGRALIALQGPQAESVLRETLDIDLADLPYMHSTECKTPCGTDIIISRLGYTGEDGFELSFPAEKAAVAWGLLLENSKVRPVGLAARDSLRLEMGYPLYGHDIDETTSPVEADLGWIMGRENTGFIGAERVLRDKQSGPARKRVGIRLLDKGVAREGAEILDQSGVKIGVLTSGGFSPTLKESIGMGYVDAGTAQLGAKVQVNVRGRNIPAEIHAMPFVPARTKSMKKKEAA